MGYRLWTKSGHNMFDMASLLQKAIRRGDYERAGYAAEEMFGAYYGMLWKRIVTVTAEDCFGVLTKEIVALRRQCEKYNKGAKGYEKDSRYVARAIDLMCRARKSRDACYYACNFILTEDTLTDRIPDDAFISRHLADMEAVNNPFSFDNLEGPAEIGQPNLLVGEPDSIAFLGACLRKGIRTLDSELSGYALQQLRQRDYIAIWKTLYIIACDECEGRAANEIVALKLADMYVNKTKPMEQRDEIYIAKSVMVLMYDISRRFNTVLAEDSMAYTSLLKWDAEPKPISECILPGGEIPDWVYDVHTIKGKKAGKTDWIMNIDEFNGLKPLQEGFYDNGSWQPRYEWKWAHGQCSAIEYDDMKEYSKARKGNPLEMIEDRFN